MQDQTQEQAKTEGTPGDTTGAVDRAELIDRAQRLGVDRPWFKSNDDLLTAIAEEEHRQGGLPTTRTTVEEPGTADADAAYAEVAGKNAEARRDAPPEGADHPDPYAHLGGSGVVTGEEEATDENDEEA